MASCNIKQLKAHWLLAHIWLSKEGKCSESSPRWVWACATNELSLFLFLGRGSHLLLSNSKGTEKHKNAHSGLRVSSSLNTMLAPMFTCPVCKKFLWVLSSLPNILLSQKWFSFMSLSSSFTDKKLTLKSKNKEPTEATWWFKPEPTNCPLLPVIAVFYRGQYSVTVINQAQFWHFQLLSFFLQLPNFIIFPQTILLVLPGHHLQSTVALFVAQ